jgi:hypothetical protein
MCDEGSNSALARGLSRVAIGVRTVELGTSIRSGPSQGH